ncbi:DUF3515 domain-containing protein [Corynebacterium hindlerae]|uniref:DUF3515 domain-containing protein n=1 Tax=Corynebacterium hindlerae TaxID=699041 RepID=UPI0031B6CD0F
MTEPAASQLNRTPLYIALGLAVVLAVGVLVGAKLVYSTAANQPVSMTALDSPDADSAECQALLDNLPKKVLGHGRAELAEPAPAGAAAWASNSLDRVTLRCGVTLPLQYTELSMLTEDAGTKWLQIIDATPGSTMQTWYSVDTFPVVAVTMDSTAAKRADTPVAELSDAMAQLKKTDSAPNPIPLTQLAAPHAADPQCRALLPALPQDLADGYTRAALPEDYPGLLAWVKPGHEPIVVRCGVADPAGYQAGAQLNQVDEIPWFEDTLLANGTTAGTYFALGRDVNVAMSMPSSAGNAAITSVSKAIAANTTAR